MPQASPLSNASDLQRLLAAVQKAAAEQELSDSKADIFRTWITTFLRWCRSHPPHHVSLNRVDAFLQAAQQQLGDTTDAAPSEAMDALSFLFGCAWKKLDEEPPTPWDTTSKGDDLSYVHYNEGIAPRSIEPVSSRSTPDNRSVEEKSSAGTHAARRGESPFYRRAKATYELQKDLLLEQRDANRKDSPARERSRSANPSDGSASKT